MWCFSGGRNTRDLRPGLNKPTVYLDYLNHFTVIHKNGNTVQVKGSAHEMLAGKSMQVKCLTRVLYDHLMAHVSWTFKT